MKNGVLFLLTVFLLISCVQKGEVKIDGLDQVPGPAKAGKIQSTLTSVSVVNDQLVINGSGFENVSEVRVQGPSGFDETFSIESKTDSNIVANGLNAISFAVGSTFDLILSNASAAATYQVTFTLQDGAVTAAKLDDMGAGDGDVLVYNQSLTTWEPSPLSSISYRGSWDASSNTPTLSDGGGTTSPTAGDFYVVSNSGSTSIDGNATWNAGDWIIYDAVNTKWDRIANTTSVSSIFGRQGSVTAQEGDYTIDQLGDVDTTTTTPGDGQVLKWDSGTSTWIVGDDLSGGGAGSVTSTEIQDGTIVNVDISSSAAIAQSKINNLTTDLAAKLPLDGTSPMAGSLDMGGNAITNVGNVDGVDVSALDSSVSTNASDISTNSSNISTNTTNIATKADEPSSACSGSDKLTWDGTSFSCAADVDTDTNTNADTLCAAGEYLDGDGTCKTASTGNGDFMADGSVPMTGDLDFGYNKARFKSDNSNYAELIAPSGLGATYSLSLPADAGTSGDVLSVDASGNLQWSTSGSGAVTSVTGSAPISSSGGDAPDISISQANGSTDGYLSSTDWNTFNDKQDAITTGSTSQYLRGDLSLSSFSTDVAGSVLGGFAPGADSTVTNTDTVETAVEKIQGQINANDTVIAGKQDDLAAPADGTKYLDGNETWQTLDTSAVTENGNLYFTESRVLGSVLSGYSTGADTALADGDTLLQALAKLEGQIQADASNAFLKDGSVSMTGAFDGGGNDLTNVGSLTTNSQGGLILNPYGTSAGNTSEIHFMELAANGSNYVGFKADDALASNIVWKLPNSNGSSGNVLTTDGAGNLSWASSGDGSVTSVTATAPIATSGGTAPDISISQANGSTNGYLSSTDWNTFNGKEPAITAGTTAQYWRGDKSWQTLDTSVVPENGNLYFTDGRAQTAVVTQTINSGTTSTSPSEDAVFSALADKVDLAGDTMTGALNLPANGLTVGTDQIVTASGNVGVGEGTPVSKLHVNGSSYSPLRVQGSNASGTGIRLINDSATNSGWELVHAASNKFHITEQGISQRLTVSQGGNVGVGTVNPQEILHLQDPANNTSLLLQSDDDGSGVGPLKIQLKRNSASPAAGDNVGTLQYVGQNSAGESEIYGQVWGKIEDTTDGAEKGGVGISYRNGGSGTSTGLYVDGDGNTGIKTTSPQSELDVNGNIAAKNRPYPWHWSTEQSGDLEITTNTWNDVPGASITYTLPANADVKVSYDGSLNANTDSNHCGVAIFMDGTNTGTSKYGNLIQMGSSGQHWNSVSRSKWFKNQAAGTHTVKISLKSINGGTCEFPIEEYGRVHLEVMGYSPN